MALPSYVVGLLGRESELALTRTALASSRCVTIAGPGGIGKSHLAVVAAQKTEAEQGQTVEFIAVDSASGRDGLTSIVANHFGVRVSASQPLASAVIEHLRSTQVLLVLDGLDAANDFEYWLFDLMHACPGVRLLATSHQRLSLPNEVVIELGALPYTTPMVTDAQVLSPAAAMFIQAVRSVAPSYRPDAAEMRDIQALCALVEGMPLAIELAAYWVPKVPVKFIVQQLLHSLEWLTDARHLTHSTPRSLQAVFDHFWSRLSKEEQRAMTRLAVFEGGFDLAAARALADVPDTLLAGLTDGYFLKPLPGQRYSLHALMRRYLLARLPETEPDLKAFETRFTQVFLDRARSYAFLNTTAHFPRLASQLSDDFSNMRSALALALRNREAAQALGLLAALGEFWRLTGRALEVRDLCARALALDVTGVDSHTRIQAATAFSLLLESCGDYEAAHRVCTQTVALADAQQLDSVLAGAAEALAHVEMRRGRYALSLEAAQLSLRAAARGGRANDRARSLCRLGNSLFHVDRLDEARVSFDEAMASAVISDEPALRMAILNDRAVLHMRCANFRSAIADLDTLLKLAQEMGNAYNQAGCLSNLGYAYLELGDTATAERYLTEAIAAAGRTGMRALASYSNVLLGRVHRLLHGSGMPDFLASLKLALEIKSERRVLVVFLLVGEECFERGDFEQASWLFGVALSHSTLSVEERQFGETVLAKLRAAADNGSVDAMLARARQAEPEAVARAVGRPRVCPGTGLDCAIRSARHEPHFLHHCAPKIAQPCVKLRSIVVGQSFGAPLMRVHHAQ